MSFPLIQIDERKIVLLSGFRSEPGNCVIVTAKSELEAAVSCMAMRWRSGLSPGVGCQPPN